MQERDVSKALRRGLVARCPSCGEGRLFVRYLTTVERCGACGEPLGEYRAADGPAFFTICIVGILLVPALGFGFVIFEPEPLTLAVTLSAAFVVLTLVVLRLVKGLFVGYLWAHDERDRGA